MSSGGTVPDPGEARRASQNGSPGCAQAGRSATGGVADRSSSAHGGGRGGTGSVPVPGGCKGGSAAQPTSAGEDAAAPREGLDRGQAYLDEGVLRVAQGPAIRVAG